MSEDKKYFEEKLRDSVRNMTPNQIVNFVQQIYSHFFNMTGFGIEDLEQLFYNCCSFFSDYNEDIEFANSLKNTLNVFDCDSNKMMDIIKKLKPNNLSSFVLLPTVSENHMFATLLYKKKDNEYELITVNKGTGTNENNYDGYIVIHDEVSYFIKNFVYNDEYTVDDIYNFLNDKKVKYGESILHNIGINSFSELKSREQKTGNCFYKNPEAGFRFAWFVAHFENKNKNQLLDNVSVTPKGPTDTAEMHNKIVDNLRKAVESVYADNKDKNTILEHIDYEKNIYNINKKFRQYCKGEAQSLEIDEIKKNILDIYECKNFKECFGMMDTESIEIFIKLFENRTYDLNLDNLKFSDLKETLNILENMKFPSFDIKNIGKRKNKRNTKRIISKYQNLVEKFTPHVPYALSAGIKQFNTEIINYNLSYFKKNESDDLLKLLEPEEEIKNVLDGYINEYKKKYKEALENYKKAYLNFPNSTNITNYANCLFYNQKPVEALKIVNNFLKRNLYEQDFDIIVSYIYYDIKYYEYSLNDIKEYSKNDALNDALKYYIRACYYENYIRNYRSSLNEQYRDENLLKAFKSDPKFIKAHFKASTSNYDKVLEIVPDLILMKEEPDNIDFTIQYIYCIAYIIENKDIDNKYIDNKCDYDELIKKCDKILNYDKCNLKACLVRDYCKECIKRRVTYFAELTNVTYKYAERTINTVAKYNDFVNKNNLTYMQKFQKKLLNFKIIQRVRNKMAEDMEFYGVGNKEEIKKLLINDDITNQVSTYLVNIMEAPNDEDKKVNIEIIKKILSDENAKKSKFKFVYTLIMRIVRVVRIIKYMLGIHKLSINKSLKNKFYKVKNDIGSNKVKNDIDSNKVKIYPIEKNEKTYSKNKNTIEKNI